MPTRRAPRTRAIDCLDPGLRLDLLRALAWLIDVDPLAAEVLMRRVILGESHTEIAAAIGCFPASVKVIGERGARWLRRSLLAGDH